MQKALFFVIILIVAGILAYVTLCRPVIIAENQFLDNFINHELLNILAIIMTVTAASAANIHLVFNRAEEAIKEQGYFDGARKEINHNVFFLIGTFIATVLILIVRSHFLDSVTLESCFNSLCLIFLLINILALIDTTRTVFAITPILPVEND